MDQVYHSLLALARFFEEAGDFWLSDHFYGSCLKTSLKIRGDGRRKESEANCNMGLASEKRGKIVDQKTRSNNIWCLDQFFLWFPCLKAYEICYFKKYIKIIKIY